ncbi:MAG: hypothetical protein Q8P84_00520 [Deltaproteobacteria bacterium]|nr:hypothetical protein [Deltaproteobacteria bacterium]
MHIIIVLLVGASCSLSFNAAQAMPYQHFLKPNEIFKAVRYPKGNASITKQIAIVFYLPRENLDMSVGNHRAFVIYNTGKKLVRLDLRNATKIDDRELCSDDYDVTIFDSVPRQDAEVIQITPNAIPELVIYGTNAGSAGFTDIALYKLPSAWLSPKNRSGSLCSESQLLGECQKWAESQWKLQSIVRYNRWMRAESIDDIIYVIRKIRGE